MRDFLEVVKSFWGIVGVLTAVFPVGNKFFLVLPLVPYQELLQTSLASLGAFYALAMAYTRRSHRHGQSLWLSIVLFALGLGVVFLYLVLYGQEGPFNAVRNASLVILYVLFASCVTAAFGIIAAREYTRSQTQGV